jgi:hypothetical protein
VPGDRWNGGSDEKTRRSGQRMGWMLCRHLAGQRLSSLTKASRYGYGDVKSEGKGIKGTAGMTKMTRGGGPSPKATFSTLVTFLMLALVDAARAILQAVSGTMACPRQAVALGVRQRRGKSFRHLDPPQDIVLWCWSACSKPSLGILVNRDATEALHREHWEGG